MENHKNKPGPYLGCKSLASKFLLLSWTARYSKTAYSLSRTISNVNEHWPDCFRLLHYCLIKLSPKTQIQQGFTLVEVLIAVLVLSIGLMGVAGIQLVGLKNNDSSYLRTQASLLANDMMDRMRANRAAAVAGNYDQALTRFEDLANPGAGAPIAQTDRYDWFSRLSRSLPNTQDTRAAIGCDATGICTVIVQWNDARAVCSSSDDPNCANESQIRRIDVAGQI